MTKHPSHPRRFSQTPPHSHPRLQLNFKPLAAALIGAGLLAVAPCSSAQTVAELQAELTRVREENARLTQQLAAQAPAAPAAAPVAAAAAPAAPQPTAAAVTEEEPQALGEVTVRGRRKIETVKEVPVSISVVSGQELDRELAQDLSAFTKRGANIQFNQNNTRGASLSVRGLGKRSFTETQDPSVGLVVDGVSYGLSQLGNFDFYDVESVEVIRGPSGTLGGKSASSGVVTVNTRKPSFYPSADLSLTYGQQETLIGKGHVGGSVIDDLLAWRGSFVFHRAQGYYRQQFDNNYSLYNKNRVSGRVQFLLTPSSTFNARLSVDLEPHAPQLQNGLTFYTTPPERFADGSLTDPTGTTARAKLAGYLDANGAFITGRPWLQGRTFNGTYTPYDWARDYIGDDRYVNFNQNQGQTVHNKGALLDLTWDLPGHTLTSNTAVRRYSFDAHNDEGTPFDINRDGGGGIQYRQFTQELKLQSKPGGKIDYVTGLFYIGTRNTITSKAGWGSDAGAWFATAAQYDRLDRNAGLNRGAGLALLRDTLADVTAQGDTYVDTKSPAIFGNLKWHVSDDLKLTAGLRFTREDRETRDTRLVESNGAGSALNPVAVRGVELGGFNSTSAGGLADANTPAQLALADFIANRYYGAAITATPGAAYRGLTTAQLAQVAAAKAIRASQIGQLSPGITSTYKETLPTAVLSPSYKFNEQITGYASWQYGEKSGSALHVNYANANVRAEKTNAFELGLKTSLLDSALILNANLFQMNIKDYQTAVRVVDEFTTQTNIANGQPNPTAYLTAQGNVPEARARGLEFDGNYNGIRNLSIRFSGAWNDARYISFPQAAKPDELAYLPGQYVDMSGARLPGSSKWTGNLGAEYKLPLKNSATLHASFNTAFNSRYNNSDVHSDYGWVSGGAVTDLAFGYTTKSNVDVSVIVKNAGDNRKHEQAWASYAPNPYPRWVGLTLSGKL